MTNEDGLRKMREELEKQNENSVRMRHPLNPLLWVGVTYYMVGFLFCLTIIGIPFGVGMIRGGRSWVYKNTSGI